MTANLYIGLMSGTSMDSIDAAIVELGENSYRLRHAINVDIPPALYQDLVALCTPGSNEIDRLGATDRQLGRIFAGAVKRLLRESGMAKHHIRAIGSHGQTIRHRPNQGDNNFSLQIGDPNTIAQETGITTVADFRRRDMAAGGQGAPLAPAFHLAAFSSGGANRAIVNIGGMANVTLLSTTNTSVGFDTGPGNILMDSWIKAHKQLAYDNDGEWAATGNSIHGLLETLLQHPFLAKPIPKSTGREEFNLPWLQQHIGGAALAPEDVQATLLAFTARTITDAILRLPGAVDEVYVCGGGAFNRQLMTALQNLLAPRPVADTSSLGIAPEWVEAAAFAWLAKRTLEGLPGNLPSVTGAREEAILGAIYPAG